MVIGPHDTQEPAVRQFRKARFVIAHLAQRSSRRVIVAAYNTKKTPCYTFVMTDNQDHIAVHVIINNKRKNKIEN